MWDDGKIRVLAVENNRDLCEILEVLIKNEEDMEWAGAAYDGLQALEKIKQATPDVVLLDIIMPNLDGMGVLQRLDEMELSKRPRIIILTAFEEEELIKKSVKLGADYYVLKPFDRDSLIQRIRQLARGDQETTPLRKTKPAKRAAEDRLDGDVSRILYKMGVPTYFKGYIYLKDAIIMVTKEIGLLGSVTKILYPRIAEKYGTTPLIVEAAIRYTIQKTWKQGNPEYINRIFGYAVNLREGKPPTNSFFIARIAEELRLGMVEEA
ncbi:MAG TPA: sporulation transcription factor Spo0A [Firmicutes bacterium]|nr:sporulation transcription factor Spo0A [Bacillota bacterium]